MSGSLRVALVTGKYPPEYSGAGLRSHNSYLRLLQACPALDLHVLCSGLEQRTRASYEQDGIPVQRIRPFLDPQSGRAAQALAGWAEALQVFAWLQRQQPTLVHVVGASAVTAAAITWARLRKVPLLIELVNAGASPAQSLPLVHHLWRPDLSHGTAIIAISAALAEECRRLGLGEIVWARPNPVYTARFFPDPATRISLRRRFTPFAAEDVVMLCLAKFMPRKNQHFLLEVLTLLPERFKLVLAGPLVSDGPLAQRDAAYLQSIRDRIAAAGLEGRVAIVPRQVEAADYFRLADLTLMPHRDEGLGTPMLESMACGVPVVANAGEAAFRQWLGDGGTLAPLESPAWVAAVQAALSIPLERRQAAAARIREVAGEAAIDRRFLHLITALARHPADQPFPLSQVLAAA